jgi:malate synthase
MVDITAGPAVAAVVEPLADARAEEVLSDAAVAFVADLQRRFGGTRDDLLRQRQLRREEVGRGESLDFLPQTRHVREAQWTVATAPSDLQDRRVEITGPTDQKMAINALNSGAKVWLADLEDANTPHWNNVVSGQVCLRDAVRRTLAFTADDGREYRLRSDAPLATIVMRPRGWHLDERHIIVDGAPAAGAIVDFGLYFFHNASELLARGSGPYFYLPKMEGHLEARLWNDIFSYAEAAIGVPYGSVRATVLIETIPAAFQMEEILYELRDHASGLNAGRWDYLFSFIKYFRDRGSAYVLPDRNQVTMTSPFIRAYTELLVTTCHRRGAFAIGGMAAFIPSRRDPALNATALAKVRQDKQREATDGFDGSWVAHPDLVGVCREEFDEVLGGRPNQLERRHEHLDVTASDLLDISTADGTITEDGLRNDVAVTIRYLAEWLNGRGAVAIFNLMEDAATAEIARSQVWQWIHNGVVLESGRTVTCELVAAIAAEELTRAVAELGSDESSYDRAKAIFERVTLDDEYVDFLTLAAYAALN